MTNVTLDAADAVELAEILEFFMQRLDILAEHDVAAFLFSECDPYAIGDLRANVARLIERFTPAHMLLPGPFPGTVRPRAPRWSWSRSTAARLAREADHQR